MSFGLTLSKDRLDTLTLLHFANQTMADINVSFIHPQDGRLIAVTLDDSMTANEALGELLAAGFIEPKRSGYELSNNGDILESNQTFAGAGVGGGSSIKVMPPVEAGGGPSTPRRNNRNVRGVSKGKFKNVRITDLHESPQAIAFLIHDYNNLEMRFNKLAEELKEERSKSQSRFTATLLLLLSQIVLSIGVNLLTSNTPIAIPVLIAGSCQVALALYLTFRKSFS